MKKFISVIFIFLISQFAFAETYSFTSEVVSIEKDYIIVRDNMKKFMLVNENSPAHTRLAANFTTTYIDGNHKSSFADLAHIGHITKAKITIENNLVKEIIVLDMQM